MTTTVVAVESRLNVVSTDQEISWVQVGIQGPAGPSGAGVVDHGVLTGLSDDDHTQYPLGAGRASGQTLIGGTQAADSLTLQGTLADGTGTAVKVRVGNAGATEALTVLESGYVGVGNSNPPYLLSVEAHGVNDGFSVTNDGRLSLGGDVNIGWTSSSLSHPATASIRMDMLDDGTFSRTALATHVVLDPPNNSANTYRAGNFYVEVPASNTVNPGNIYCASASAYHYGSGTLSLNCGLVAFAYNQAGGTIATNIGYQNQCYNQSTGVITSNFAINCLASNQSSGSIGTNKGGELVARNSGSGTVTTNIGASAIARKSGAGSVTTNVGAAVSCINSNASGSITTQIGVEIGGVNSAWSNSGTITSSTALLIGSSTNVGTNKKAIHSDSSAQSYLAGGLAIGLDSASAKLHSVATTEQLRLGYDAAKYASFTVDSSGKLKIAAPLIITPPASITPATNGDLTIEATSNTTLTFSLKGSDGVVRSASLTLA